MSAGPRGPSLASAAACALAVGGSCQTHTREDGEEIKARGSISLCGKWFCTVIPFPSSANTQNGNRKKSLKQQVEVICFSG